MTVLVLGIAAFAGAMPSASAAKAQWHDNDKDGSCPSNFPFPHDFVNGYPEEYDRNGDGVVCSRYVG